MNKWKWQSGEKIVKRIGGRKFIPLNHLILFFTNTWEK